ncbi:MAG: S8 family peptidase [Prevotella sp.]|nr:S8 family peptidase [Prevotella sp.]
MERNKPHLWIPEQEITDVSKKPTGRKNDYGLDYVEHGEVLSEGLRDIVAFYQKLEAADFSEEEDTMAFRVILQEKEDISNTKNLLEEEGIKINAVRDKRHAVVSTRKTTFKALQNKVEQYKDAGVKKDFQLIEAFAPFTGADKKTSSLLKYFQDYQDDNTVDVQFMLMPKMDADAKVRVQARISEKIAYSQGRIEDAPYHLTDGTVIIRAIVSASALNKISEDPGIYRVEQTVFFGNIAPATVLLYPKATGLKPDVSIDTLPAVVVLDDGVDFPDELESVVSIHWQASDCKSGAFGDHGTAVASKVAFADLGAQLEEGLLIPRARIIDARIADDHEMSPNVFLSRIQEAVANFAQVAKIFNLSYNANMPIEGDQISILGSEIDMLCKKYSICFVISAGNHQLVFTENTLDDIIDDDDSRIAEPADAMLGITVGAVVGVTHTGSVSKENQIAPYSRRGPGFCDFYKPDLVAYGATQLKDGTVPTDLYAICQKHDGVYALAGTSFTAPVVAGDLAEILSVVPGQDVFLAQALLYNGARHMYDINSLTKDEVNMLGNLYGRGLSSPAISMYSSEDSVSYIHSGTLNRLTKERVKFHMPSVIADMKVKRGEKKVRVTVTCIAHPPIDRDKGSEYSAAYIRTSIHRINSKGRNVVDNPSVSDNRNPWDTCYHFSKEFSAFDAGDWEVWLELFTRWDIRDDEEISYALVITVEDLTMAGNLYSETIRETAGRFKPIETVRVKV